MKPIEIRHFNVDMLLKMRHSPVRNYAIPGLTSWMIGQPDSEYGCIRMFQCDRDHQEPITPHSHRFDLQCVVLEGRVTNRIWTPVHYPYDKGDQYSRIAQEYEGSFGDYVMHQRARGERYEFKDYVYGPGDTYSMEYDEIHSIYFAKGTKVLVFEGPQRANESTILLPYVNGETIDTFRLEPWMFKREHNVPTELQACGAGNATNLRDIAEQKGGAGDSAEACGVVEVQRSEAAAVLSGGSGSDDEWPAQGVHRGQATAAQQGQIPDPYPVAP